MLKINIRKNFNFQSKEILYVNFGLGLKDKFLKNENLYKFDMDIYKVKDQLISLTGNIPPKELLQEMMKISWEEEN